ncbi:hypothetical protein OSB04_006251 [Centaurea solstitialis]|uniref:Myb/SANT-like domain-containing protein n=1 Tax=Centaurea solstitialis TaxID=347529 RepID=A0AA38TVD7_9ASTR|nr:hypothetical protein OSB04_006251 [Centaurea solstitialis]
MSNQLRNYRNWTNEEACVDMVNKGAYKADNGFKSGYLQHLEQALKITLPTSDLKARPHIESKMKVMRVDWQIVYDMVHGTNTSGFGYDPVTHCVTADAEVWKAYLMVHKRAKKWQNKSFPHFNDLCTIFGKDRAQGNEARDVEEMQENVDKEEPTQELDADDDDEVEVESSQVPPPRSHSTEFTSRDATNKGKNKRKADPMVEAFQDAVKFLGEGLTKMSNKMTEREEEFDKKRTMVTSEISKMESLTMMQKFKAGEKIRDDIEKVKVFCDLNDADRVQYVKYILEQ